MAQRIRQPQWHSKTGTGDRISGHFPLRTLHLEHRRWAACLDLAPHATGFMLTVVHEVPNCLSFSLKQPITIIIEPIGWTRSCNRHCPLIGPRGHLSQLHGCRSCKGQGLNKTPSTHEYIKTNGNRGNSARAFATINSVLTHI